MDLADLVGNRTRTYTPCTELSDSQSIETLYPDPSVYGRAPRRNEVVSRNNEAPSLAGPRARPVPVQPSQQRTQLSNKCLGSLLDNAQSAGEVTPTTPSSWSGRSVGTLRPEDKKARKKEDHRDGEAGRRKEESKRRDKIAKLLPDIFLINAKPKNKKQGTAHYTKNGVLDGVIMFLESLPTEVITFIESLPADARAKAEGEVRNKAEEIKRRDLKYWLSSER